MTPEVWDSIREDIASELMLEDGGKLTQNVKVKESSVTGPISATDLAQ